MKKQLRKLTLSKETLKVLREQGLRDVHGGTEWCSIIRCPISWGPNGPTCDPESNPCP